MSLELLEELDAARAFEATRRFEDLSAFHVPFDQLTGEETTESPLRTAAENGGKVVLAGRSGAGKSSVIASVLGPLVEDLAEEIVPLRIPVAATNATTATEPGAFAQHLVRTVLRYATEILPAEEQGQIRRLAADTSTLSDPTRTRRLTVGAPKLIMDTGFAAEVKSGAEGISQELTSGEAVGALVRLVEVFHAKGRAPFFVIDDSDRWTRVAGEDATEVADRFFGRIVPMLAREIDCGFVLAAHPDYANLDSYRRAQELLTRKIELSTPPDAAGAIVAILNRRIELAGLTIEAAALIREEAIEALTILYLESQSLRRVLAVIDRATQHACTDRVAPIGVELVQTAQADLT